MASTYLAFDMGAESGRAFLGRIDSGRLAVEELHRFPTQGITVCGTWQWDITRIYADVLEGMSKCAAVAGPDIDGIGIDTWGVDYGLLASDGSLLGNPVHYRDARTEGLREAAFSVVPPEEIYGRTGITSHPFNTLYQLLSMARAKSPVLSAADEMLFVGPLLGYFLCGERSCEFTIASTSQMLRAGSSDWDKELLEKLGIPTGILPEVTNPGDVIGKLLPDVAKTTGLGSSVPYISTAVHDTAAAVVAVPAAGGDEDWAYLSSGTWSLLGAEIPDPVVSEETRTAGFTNEGGVEGTIRFLKNIFGLWIVQECRRAWLREAKTDEERARLEYPELVRQAEASEPFKSVIGLEDGRLLAPENMVETVRALCLEAGEIAPTTHGEMMRCALESLALCYRRNLRRMDELLGRTTKRLHIIGGGAKNELLCQMAADACGIPVYTGPIEAAAIGNVLVQAMGTGAISSLVEARKIVANSFEVRVYAPGDTGAWDRLDQRVPKS